MLGIFGRSGSSKSTLIRLLQGINRDYSGYVKMDGSDLREVNLLHLRQGFGVELQDNFLFRGSLVEADWSAKTASGPLRILCPCSEQARCRGCRRGNSAQTGCDDLACAVERAPNVIGRQISLACRATPPPSARRLARPARRNPSP